MKPYVKLLRKDYQNKVQAGLLCLDDHCAKCKLSVPDVNQLELHHKVALKDVDPDSGFNPNTQDNLVTLCHECHKGYHVSYEDMDMNEWLTDVPLDVIYEKLASYRKQKEESRKQARRKHRKGRYA